MAVWDFGITGFDVTREALQEAGVASQVHFLHDALGFGKCKLVVAVPEKWEARTMSDLAH
ncbi:MAG: hypothetical protein HC853_15045, partial [Anaerolineae bacterium]|nr:hypothetical protein [Anaerolineae bacterium]